MVRLFLAAALVLPVLAAFPAQAFWKRSQWEACNEAPTREARARLNCWMYEPIADWPVPALEPGYRRYIPHGADWHGYGRRGPDRHGPRKGTVVRRLG